MSENPADRTRVRELNDELRRTFSGGRVLLTQGINQLSKSTQALAIRQVQTFDAFTPDKDPHSEHDFGNFDLAGHNFFWKIDYYTPDLQGGSDDPADPAKTTRVLTIMLTMEYQPPCPTVKSSHARRGRPDDRSP